MRFSCKREMLGLRGGGTAVPGNCVEPPGWAPGPSGLPALRAERPDRVSSSVVRVSSGMETPEAVRLCDGRELPDVTMGAGA